MTSDLQSLKFIGPDVTDADLVKSCVGKVLTRVELERCDGVTDVSSLAGIETLEEVRIVDCKRLRYFGSLGEGNTSLRRLFIINTPLTGAQMHQFTSNDSLQLVTEQCGNFLQLQRPSQALVKSSIDLIRKMASQFNPNEIGVAFNGGKDSVVMMDLLDCALGCDMMSKLCIFTLGTGSREEFIEVVDFRNSYLASKGLSIVEADPTLSMRDGLAQLKEKRGISLVFMGTRSSDSAHQTKIVEPTTTGWPEMLRACPVFNWGYEDIWGYTLPYNLPFCVLYKMGYTSLGGRCNTSPNPLLRRSDGTFRPAWELQDALEERSGRLVKG